MTAFPLKVREQGAGLEDGRCAGAIGAWLERVCGRLRRPQSRRRVGSKSGSPLGGEGAQGTGAKLA